jgi:hypothetical protein
LLECYISGDFTYRQRSFDVGVVQSDSLNMDLTATRDRWQKIIDTADKIILEEVAFIAENDIRLIFGDIPPIATLIAQQAGIPCWLSSNFGWDLIYRAWGQEFAQITNWIVDCYERCDRLFRVPLHEPMARFPDVVDVGLTGGDPKYNLADLQTKFNLDRSPAQTILLSFGGLGVDGIPYQNLLDFPECQFITLDRQAPDLPNLVKILDRQYRPVDFMPLCGRIISKPGYTTYAEALKLDIPVCSISREGFAESEIIMNGLQDYGHHQIVSPDRFFSNNWDFLNTSLSPPRTSQKLAKDGNQAIASSIVDYYHHQ